MKNTLYKGVSTNNLKHIDVEIPRNQLVCISGVSGSGKSSLAYDTMAAISMEEYGRLTSDQEINYDYHVDYYENVQISVPLKQLNFNVNPRSTISTYFGLNKSLNYIISTLTGLSMGELDFNGYGSCRECGGLSYNYVPDENLIVDWKIPLKDNPFLCWHNSYKELYCQLLNCYCNESGIDANKTMDELPDDEKQSVLYGRSKEKYKIVFRTNGKTRTKTSYYFGPMLEIGEGSHICSTISFSKYTKMTRCHQCNGSRLKKDISNIEIIPGVTVGELVTIDFNSLLKLLDKFQNDDKFFINAVKHIRTFIDMAIKLGIGYLSFTRGIPSLSGGELQRLRLANIFSGNLVDLMIIVDEPTASLHPSECEVVTELLSGISKNNTIVAVEHNKTVLSAADKVIYLGRSGGEKGGYLITKEEFDSETSENGADYFAEGNEVIKLKPSSEFISYAGDMLLHNETLNVICGTSGCGKSVILREFLPYVIDGYEYISQKPIKGNINSTIGTYTGLADETSKLFAKVNNTNVRDIMKNGSGACKKCAGTGRINMGNYYGKPVYMICEDCKGTGYSSKSLKILVSGKNIADIFSMPLLEIEKYIKFGKKGESIINLMKKLHLEHLSLDRRLSTLSGGENQRLKLVMALQNKSNRVIGLDEPVKGLSEKEINSILRLLYEQVSGQNKTFVIAEHSVQFIKGCSYITELVRNDFATKIVYSGNRFEIKKCGGSVIKKWL